MLCITFFLCVCVCVFFFFFFSSFALFCFSYIKKNSVYFVYIGNCVLWMAIEIKFSKFCISCNLDEHLYAQLIK